MILVIRTDKPEAEIGLINDGKQIAYDSWQAHRKLAETIHIKIEGLLKSQDASLENIKGIVAYKGPGSFTGLRIGISVANALSYLLGVPIASSGGKRWVEIGVKKLEHGPADKLILPEYGSAARTTEPKI